jgi:urease accessory protein
MRLGPNCRLVVAAPLLCVALALALLPGTPASAHWVDVGNGSWAEGLTHPFSGLDHVVAMIAIGLWASVIGRAALWLLPMGFLASMAMGAALSFHGIVLPGAEDAAAVSVAVLGVLLAVAARPPFAVGAGIAGSFGVAYGFAHGAEIADAAAPFLYGLGLLTATAMLHLAGIALGLAARSPLGQKALPVGAAAIAGLGVTLMLAL